MMNNRRRFMVEKKPSIDYGYNYIDCVFDVRDGEETTTLISNLATQINASNCTIYVDDEEIPFVRSFPFATAGYHRVVYKFHTQMTDLTRMFSAVNVRDVDANKFDASKLATINCCFNGAKRLYTFDAREWVNDIGVDMTGTFGWCPFERVIFGKVKVYSLKGFCENTRNDLLDRDYHIIDMRNCYGEVASWDRIFRRQMGGSYMRECWLDNIVLGGSLQELFGWGEQALVEFRIKGLPKGDNAQFNGYNNLSVASLLSILNALPQLTSDESYTLTLGNTNLNKLTSEQKQIAIDKGWTLK